jgi:oxygen-dependent protoporphyrinogen oxidase
MSASAGRAGHDARRVAAVIGGGITGLAAAHRLVQSAGERGLDLDVRLLEGGDRPGGVIATERRDGFVMELGPDSILATKPAGMALVRELALEPAIVGTAADRRRSFVARGDRLYPVPERFYLMAPTAIGPFVTSGLFSWPGKLRMAMDLVLPARRGGGDESLASFVRRRLGQEALARVAQPMVGGIYAADPEELSLEATMPHLLALERAHGSLIRGLVRSGTVTARDAAAGPRYGLLVSLDGGLSRLVDALANRLPAGSLRLAARVVSVARGARRRYRISAATGPEEEADLVCVALPAPRAAEVLRDLDAELAGLLAAIRCASAATLNLAYRSRDVPHSLDGMGFVVPAVERTTLMACSFSSRKYPGRAPDSTVLLRAFVGGALHTHAYGLPDDALVAGVRADLKRYLGIDAEPVLARLARHDEAMPQYRVGHLALVAAIEARAALHPGLALAGNAYRGVGIPDCIESGWRSAERLLADAPA